MTKYIEMNTNTVKAIQRAKKAKKDTYKTKKGQKYLIQGDEVFIEEKPYQWKIAIRL